MPEWLGPVANQSKPSHRDFIPAQNGAHANTGLAFFMYIKYSLYLYILIQFQLRVWSLLYSHRAANPSCYLLTPDISPFTFPPASSSYLPPVLWSIPSSNTGSVPSHLQATLPSLSPCVALLKSDPFGGTYFESALRHSSSSSKPAIATIGNERPRKIDSLWLFLHFLFYVWRYFSFVYFAFVERTSVDRFQPLLFT